MNNLLSTYFDNTKDGFFREGLDHTFKDLNKIYEECASSVENFHNEHKDLFYNFKGIEGRSEVAMEFFDNIKHIMGIDAELSFIPMSGTLCGGFKPKSNTIELNSRYLENPSCNGLLNTILHESRHAFQMQCIQNPQSCNVSPEIINMWKNNITHYIPSSLDYQAYRSQPIEADAFAFADNLVVDDTNFA